MKSLRGILTGSVLLGFALCCCVSKSVATSPELKKIAAKKVAPKKVAAKKVAPKRAFGKVPMKKGAPRKVVKVKNPTTVIAAAESLIKQKSLDSSVRACFTAVIDALKALDLKTKAQANSLNRVIGRPKAAKNKKAVKAVKGTQAPPVPVIVEPVPPMEEQPVADELQQPLAIDDQGHTGAWLYPPQQQ
jgi:hypothetical protein